MTKRQRQPPSKAKKKKYYAVAVGRNIGVYETWADCERQVKQYSGARFQSFPTLAAAAAFVRQNRSTGTFHSDTVSVTPSHAVTGVVATTSTNHVNHKKRQRITSSSSADSDKDNHDTATTTPKNNDNDNTWRVKLMFDGGARGNPGPGGAGAIVTIRQTTPHGSTATTLRIRHFLGTACTNNEAEYSGLCQGLQAVLTELKQTRPSESSESLSPDSTKTLCPTHLELQIVGDSQLILRQVQGIYQCHKAHLRVYLQQVHDLLAQISSCCPAMKIHYQHVLRAQNTIADGLANQAMDKKRSWTTVDNNDDETKAG